jgi:hypothetical protein
MRTAGILLSLVGALALVGCGDDTEKPVIKLDNGVTQDTNGGQQDSFVPQEQGTTKFDKGTTTGSNSGAICSSTVPCPDTSEGCFPLSGGTKGMCLGACNAQGANCKVANASTQLSTCAIKETTSSKLYCAWICESGGKTYKCPNDTDYSCIVLDPNQPTTKVCAPKTGPTVDGGAPQG